MYHHASLPAINSHRQTYTVSQALVEKICTTYPREQARKDGIYYWPDPLPTPDTAACPDPLVLFSHSNQEAEQRSRITLVPMPFEEMLAVRSLMTARPSMQIPLGLVDKPEQQRQETFIVDLHGSMGALSGGPLLIAGTQNSGKGTALQTILLWLTTRYFPQQLQIAILDPLQELDMFQDIPHLQGSEHEPFYTQGLNDKQVTAFCKAISDGIQQRKDAFPDQRWDENTLSQLWSQQSIVPQKVIVISNYHRFIDQPVSFTAIKKLMLAITEARSLGFYLIFSSAETATRYLPADILGKVGTRIGLFMNEQQRFEFVGRGGSPMEPIAGRGVVMNREKRFHEVQLALPISGEQEAERIDSLKDCLTKIRMTE